VREVHQTQDLSALEMSLLMMILHQSEFLSLCLSLYQYVSLPSLCVSFFVCETVCLSVCLLVCLSVAEYIVAQRN